MNDNNLGLIQEEDLLDNETLIHIAYEYIKKGRGNITDLKIESIGKTTITMVNENTGEENLMGYGEQIISFRQLINDTPVSRPNGIITIWFGKDGIITYYSDNTIIIQDIFLNNNSILSLDSAINSLVWSYDHRHPASKMLLSECELVFHNEGYFEDSFNLYSVLH